MASPTGQALTLDQWAHFANKPLITECTMSLYDNPSIMKYLPFMTHMEMEVRGERYTFINPNSRPTASWVPLNSDPVLTQTIPVPFTEQLYLLRNGFRIDYILKGSKNLYTDPFDAQFNAWMEYETCDFNYKFLYNDHNNGDKNAPVGLNARLIDPAYQTPSDLLIDAGGVPMTTAATASNGITFERYVDMALDHLGANDGEGCVILVGDTLRRAWSATTKTAGAGGGFKMTEDAFDRQVETYRKAKILYVGRQADQMTQIITPTELASGAQSTSGAFTSAYVVRFGKKYLHAWQPEILAPKAMGRNPITNANYNVVVNWGVGLIQQNIRSFARIFDISVTPTA